MRLHAEKSVTPGSTDRGITLGVGATPRPGRDPETRDRAGPRATARFIQAHVKYCVMSHNDASDRDEAEDDLTLIREGRDFETEYRLTAAEAGRFLVEVGEQLQEGDELTITGDEWTLPFAFGEPVELEIDYEGYGERELQIEVEIPGTTDETAPTVE